MRSYSLDLRKKIVESYDKGDKSQREVAENFGVSVSFVEKLLSRRRKTGDIAPLPHGKGPKGILDEEALRVVRQLVQEQPDATLSELCDGLYEEFGIRVCLTTMWKAVKRLKLALKKSHSMPQNRIVPG